MKQIACTSACEQACGSIHAQPGMEDTSQRLTSRRPMKATIRACCHLETAGVVSM